MIPNVVTTIFAARDMMSQKISGMQHAMTKFSEAGKKAFSFGRKAAVTGAIIAAPFVVAAKQAVEFEDRLSDVAKTTGIQGAELRRFGDDILEMSTKTRSSIDDITTIAEIGGRLGIAKKDLKGFTVEANKFAVALGGDFSGGVESAITEFGKIKSLFSDTRDLDVSESLKKSGSAFNALSAQGVNVEGLTDFSLRVGALPEVMRPSLASTSALGATLQKSGVDAQIASSGFSNFITKAATQLPKFAKEMGISTGEAQKLINTDTALFFAKFSAKMKGVPADKLAIKLKNLGLNSLEVQKAVGAMSGSLDTYQKLQGIASDQMQKGTSITEEYNTKNNNTAGQMARLRNNLKALAITVGNALLPVITSLAESVAPILKSAGEWMRRNKGLVSTIAKVALGISAFSFAISGLAYIFGGLQKVIAAVSVAIKVVGLVANATVAPFIALAALAVGLGIALYEVSKAFDSSTASQRVNEEVTQRAIDKTADQRAEMAVLFNTLRQTEQGTDAYKEALVKIDKMSPGLVAKYNLQEKSLKRISEAEKQLTKDIMQRAMVEARAEILKEKIKEQMTRVQEGTSTSQDIAGLFFGPGTSTSLFAEEMKGRKEEIDVLSKQVTQDQISAAESDTKGKKDQLEININGLPEGSTATADGKTVGVGGNNSKPKLGFTR